jgi:branched-chain amino acid transport system substrate-binding protein
MRRRIASIACAGLALILPVACGSDDGTKESQISGYSLTVYSSLPLRGPLAPVSTDIVRAEKLALLDAGGRAGPFTVSYVSLDSADPNTGRWSPGIVAANARKAVQDRQTIAYLGELENGASAVSLPILNEGGILQVSPRDTLGGLTGPGGRGEPDKYYPSGRRTFARVVPGDETQAQQLVASMRDAGVQRIVLADDRELSGSSIADRIERLAAAEGIEVMDRLRLNARGAVPDNVGLDVLNQRADAFFYGGAYGPFALQVLQQVHQADPAVDLYAPDDLAIAPELPTQAGDAADRLLVTGVRPPAGGVTRSFERRFRAIYGTPPDPQAVLGYDAMRLVLAAIGRAGAGASSRRAVIAEALRAAGRPRATFGRFRVQGNRLVPVG